MKFFILSAFGVVIFTAVYAHNVRLVDWLRFQSLGTRDKIVQKLSMMFIDLPPHKVLLYMVASAFVPFMLTFLAFLPRLLPGLILGTIAAIIGWKLPLPIVNFLQERRNDKFSVQMVDGLALLGNAMKSGLSVVQGMGIVVDQAPNPLSQEFNLVLSENKIGVSFEDALVNLSKRIPTEDVEMFVTSVVILKETGGNLAETFDTIVDTIRERVKVQNRIKAMTAQGYYQGMTLLAIPPLMALMISTSEPGFMDPVFDNPMGWVAIGTVVFLEIAAYFAIKKVMKIDV